DSSLVPLQEEGRYPPLFMIAGVGGHVFTFHKFSRLLGKDQPVYGVKAIGVEGTQTPPETIEEMAAHYVKEITALKPKGPYLVSGYSVGAVVAYEVAVQLRALGHEVPLLIVFDMYAPGYPKKLPVYRRLWMHFRTFLGLGFKAKGAYLKERFGQIKARVYHRLGLGLKMAPEIKGVEALPQDALKRVWLALVTAQQRYRPRLQFDGKVVLFKAEAGFHWAATVFDDPKLGWGQWVTGGIEEHTIPGGHLEMFHDQHIQVVAEKLGESLRRNVQACADAPGPE